MDAERLSQLMKVLGDPTRLKILECLRACSEPCQFDDGGSQGATVGFICCTLFEGKPAASKVSFHLKELRHVGLVQMERQGRFMLCTVREDTVAELLEGLSRTIGGSAGQAGRVTLTETPRRSTND